MNLADAIRMAAQESGEPLFTPAPTLAPQQFEAPRPARLLTGTSHPVQFNVVLTPEQLAALFQGVEAAGRGVLTLREAARHLRVPPRALETMAQDGQIPAILIEGKWRFARKTLDEWLNSQPFRKEMEA